MNDVKICIGTVGYPTFNKCYKIAEKIAEKDSRVKDLVVIENKYPTSAWLNEMRTHIDTDWVLQVDEDMYLYENCIDELLKLGILKRKKHKILNASSLLYDLFLDTKIGSLKLWNTESFPNIKFSDVKGSDRKIAIDAEKLGFYNVSITKVLGEHDSAPSPEIAYFKYKEYVSKIKTFDSDAGARKFLKHLKKISIKRGDTIGKFAYEGGIVGYKNGGSIKNSKNYKNNLESNEILELRKKYNIGGDNE